jgi:hypothetical protein
MKFGVFLNVSYTYCANKGMIIILLINSKILFVLYILFDLVLNDFLIHVS